MCGRARCTLRAHDIPRASHRSDDSVRHVNMDRYNPSYNVGPGMNLPVLRQDDGSSGNGGGGAGAGVVLHCMKWGLIPSFTKKTDKPDFYRMFNARSESVCEKASFRRLLPKNRCLVAVEGFYEWKKDGSKKQPYYIHFKDGRPLVFAALYDSWENSEGEKVYTFTILTTSSSPALQWLHDRMPVIFGDKESTDTWLSGCKIDTLLKPYKNSDLVWYPVTPAVGKLSFEGPDCVKEVPLKTQEKNPISKFFSTREVKKEQESNMEQSLYGESVKNNLQKNIKEEPKITVKGIPSTETEEHESKCNALIPTGKDALKRQTKRGYEEFSADTKPVKEEIETSPARKKGNMKGGSDKQPTLFSYFGKK